MCFWSIGLAALLVVEEHRVSNENVEDERFQDVHHLHLPATANDEIERLLLMEPMATRGTWVPPASMSKSGKGEARNATRRGNICINLPHACCERAEILFHFCECGHLDSKGIDDLFNIGNPGCEKDHRVGDGLDVAFIIGNIPQEW